MLILRNTQNALKSLPKKKYRNRKQRLRQIFISFPKKKRKTKHSNKKKRKNVRDRSQQDFGSLIIWTAGNDKIHTHTSSYGRTLWVKIIAACQKILFKKEGGEF